jgi:hypothetical protein
MAFFTVYQLIPLPCRTASLGDFVDSRAGPKSLYWYSGKPRQAAGSKAYCPLSKDSVAADFRTAGSPGPDQLPLLGPDGPHACLAA